MGMLERFRERRKKRVIYHWIKKHVGGFILWTAMACLMLLKPFTFLHPILPKKVRETLQSWDWEMFRLYVFSFGRRAYIDKRCELHDPPTFDPLVQAPPEFQFSAADIERFYNQGFLGPFTLCSPEEMYELREKLQREIEQPSTVYGMATGRDRHLDCPTLWKLLRRPEWTERIAQLLGPNLLLWRSQVFLKPPGAPEITWHQASCYLSEEAYKATLFPRDIDKLFQLTTWVAFDDVDLENGCMQFLPGTQRKINQLKFGGDESESFAKAKIKLDCDASPDKVVTMDMKAGQFVIFTERCIHGSPPNSSKDRRRWGMAFRTIVPDCKVYGDDVKNHHVRYLEQDFNLDKWGCVVLRGKDTAGVNRTIEPLIEPVQVPDEAPPGDSDAVATSSLVESAH